MPASLRLTLRTLLSYLDDTLDPAQAKLIGQKVAESEQARELMERIRQVTRKRRLTTPPPAGPGGIDANTIAEYLDNDVTPEQAEEVERICLASDVHLAEVAACHQILTLVLGEPALVPPSARQRMYGLVKGPEAIPFRKPPRKKPQADLDLSTSDAGQDGDESMRMPSFMRNASVRNTVLLVGGGLVAVAILIFSLTQFLHNAPNKQANEPDRNQQNQQVVQVDPNKDNAAKTDAAKEDDIQRAEKKRLDDEAKKKAFDAHLEEEARKQAEEKRLAEEKQKAEVNKTPDKKAPIAEVVDGQEEIPYGPPDVTPVVLGTYEPNAKVQDVTLQRDDADKGNWTRLVANNAKVASVRPLMSLPASRGSIQLKKGLHLTLWGTTPEIWPNPYLFESRVRLYNDPVLALDMALRRGRVVIKNTRTDDKPPMIRVRFDNPMQKHEEAFTIALLDKDASVMIDHAAHFPEFPLNESFHEDKESKDRVGPIVEIHMFLLSGTAYLRWAGFGQRIDASKEPQHVHWNSVRGKTEGPERFVPDWVQAKPKVGDPKSRADTMAASQRLAANLQGKQLDVVLQEAVESDNPATKRLALFCYTALDDYTKPMEFLDKDDPKLSDLRRMSIYALRYWMAQRPNNEYKVYEAFQSNYKGVVAKKLMELLHGITAEQDANPATWKVLIDNLNNEVLPIRELSAWNLEASLATRLPKAAELIATKYAAIAPEPYRAQVQQQLRLMIPPGQVPPPPGAAPQPGPAQKKK